MSKEPVKEPVDADKGDIKGKDAGVDSFMDKFVDKGGDFGVVEKFVDPVDKGMDKNVEKMDSYEKGYEADHGGFKEPIYDGWEAMEFEKGVEAIREHNWDARESIKTEEFSGDPHAGHLDLPFYSDTGSASQEAQETETAGMASRQRGGRPHVREESPTWQARPSQGSESPESPDSENTPQGNEPNPQETPPGNQPGDSAGPGESPHTTPPGETPNPQNTPPGNPQGNTENPQGNPPDTARPTENPTTNPSDHCSPGDYPPDSARPTDCSTGEQPTDEPTTEGEDDPDENPTQNPGGNDQPPYPYEPYEPNQEGEDDLDEYPTENPRDNDQPPYPYPNYEPQPRDYPVREPDQHAADTERQLDQVQPKGAHCQGGRLLIVAGDFKSSAMQHAMEWAANLYKGKTGQSHIHILAYDVGPDGILDMRFPHVPSRASKTGWKRLTHLDDTEKAYQTLDPDCCYLEEFLLVLDARKTEDWDRLLEYLPSVLTYKPLRKIVLWPLAGGANFTPAGKGIYERLCGLTRPKDCPCDCDRFRCKAFDPEGRRASCPHQMQPVKMLTLGMERDRIAVLKLDTRDEMAPLVSSSKQLREITITPDGWIKPKLLLFPDPLFGALRWKADSRLAVNALAPTSTANSLLHESRVIEPKPGKRYIGPEAGQGGEGCFLDSGEK